MESNGLAAKLRVVSRLLRTVLLMVLLAPVPVGAQGSSAPGGPALDQKDCRTLMMLYSALRDQGVEPDEAPAVAVGDAILNRPGCGETRAALQEVRRGSGVNPWDERAPGGFGVEQAEQEEAEQ